MDRLEKHIPAPAGARFGRSRGRALLGRGWVALSLTLLVLASGGGCVREPASSRLSVYASSSLREVFLDLRRGFLERYPNTQVDLSFAGSQVLRLQIEAGARADVFASAAPGDMEALRERGHVEQSQVLVENELVVIVPTDNPAGIVQFEDLPLARRVVVGSEGGPVGSYTRLMLQRAGEVLGEDFSEKVRGNVVSKESNVRLVRAKVELGEADAAIVYRTDALASERVSLVEIPPGINPRAQYQIGLMHGGLNPTLGEAWLEFVVSPWGSASIRRHGFLEPERGQ